MKAKTPSYDHVIDWCLLFFSGVFLSLLVDKLLTSHNIASFPRQLYDQSFTASWMPPTVGICSIGIGVVFPYFDIKRSKQQNAASRTSILRMLGGFLGIMFAATKLPQALSSQVQVTMLMYSLCIALWFLGDRSFHGLLCSCFCSVVGTMIASTLGLNGVYIFNKPDFLGIPSWIPCLLFSGTLCIGCLGRKLQYKKGATVEA